MAIKIRRGTDSARLAVIFEEGEVVYTTDTKSFFIGDGVTAGGNQIGGTTAASLLKATVHNATGVTLTKGQVVYLNGNTGNKPNAVLAQANSEATSSKTIGLIILNISNNASGDIATDGLIGDLNTSAFVAGDLLWLSDSIAGGVTTIIPDTPSHAVFIGYVVSAHPTLGSILIHIQNGYELNEIHDVKITSVQNNDGLIYDSSLGYWKNSNTITVQGNTFNAANKLVQLDGTAKLPAVDGSQLTNLPTPATPTLASVTTAGNTTTNAITVGGLTVDTDTLFVDATNNRVGIGTNAPIDLLHIEKNQNAFTSIVLLNTVSNTLSRTGLNISNGIHALEIFQSKGYATKIIGANEAGIFSTGVNIGIMTNGASSILKFAAGGSSTSQMTLFSNGNLGVGVGTTDAGYKLDVNGTARVKGTGTTSATTSFRVQDSTGTDTLSIKDNGALTVKLVVNSPGFSASNTGYLSIADRVVMRSPSDSNLTLLNSAETSFGRLNFGGITSSFPAIKRALNNIEVKNADDTYGAGLSVGAALNTSAILQADSTTKGILFPRMTTTQKNAIATPASGLVVYDTTLNKLCVYGAASWETITSI